MSRARSGLVSKNRHKKVLKMSKGFRGRSHNCYKIAIQRLEKAMQYSYRDRRARKRQFRRLWIARINAAARLNGMVYSQLMNGLKKAGIEMDRKVLAELAISQPEAFKTIAEQAKSALR